MPTHKSSASVDTPRVSAGLHGACAAQRAEIVTMFSRFVNHKRIIFKTGRSQYYGSARQQYAMDRCVRMAEHLKTLVLINSICRNILLLEADLVTILPSHTNASYQSSVEQLDNLLQLCRKLAS